MERKHISFTLDAGWYNRWKRIAEREYRNVAGQTAMAVKRYILQYEQEKPASADAGQTENAIDALEA